MKINLTWALLVVAVVIAVGVGAYIYGTKQSSTPTLQEEVIQQNQLTDATQKALQEATEANNPFKVTNPLEGVQVNPFKKAKDQLNPFK